MGTCCTSSSAQSKPQLIEKVFTVKHEPEKKKLNRAMDPKSILKTIVATKCDPLG